MRLNCPSTYYLKNTQETANGELLAHGWQQLAQR